jgi:hypothetical protein
MFSLDEVLVAPLDEVTKRKFPALALLNLKLTLKLFTHFSCLLAKALDSELCSVTFLMCIRKNPFFFISASTPASLTDFYRFSSVPPCKCRDNAVSLFRAFFTIV